MQTDFLNVGPLVVKCFPIRNVLTEEVFKNSLGHQATGLPVSATVT